MQNLLGDLYERCFENIPSQPNASVIVLDRTSSNSNDAKLDINFIMNPSIKALHAYMRINTIIFERIKSIEPKENHDFTFKTIKTDDDNTLIYILSHTKQRQKLYPLVAMKLDTWLSVCKKNVINIRPTISSLKYLKTLQLCCNNLTILPDEICELKQLYKLILARNKIKKLPDNIGLLRNLRELNISNNNLKCLPKSIASLRKLVILNISHNNLVELQSTIGGCKSLKYILISHNTGIKYLPATLTHLPFLASIEHHGITFDEISTTTQLEPRVLPLEEISLREIMNNNLEIPKDNSKYFYNKIATVKECYYCGSAFFDSYYICNFEKRLGPSLINFQAFTCKNHFKNEQEYLNNLFLLMHNRTRLRASSNYPRLSEIFTLSCYSVEKLREIFRYRAITNKSQSMPIFAIMKDIKDVSYDYITYAAENELIVSKDDYQIYNDI